MKEKTHEHCFSARATSACRHAAGRVEVHRIGEPDDDEIISVVPLESSRRDLHNTLLCTALKPHFLPKIARILAKRCYFFQKICEFSNLLNFVKINNKFEIF